MSLTTVQPISENVAIPASMPVTNLGVSQNAPQSISQTAPMVDTSPKFATSCCTAFTQTQPILQSQQPQVQTLVVPSQTVPTVVVRPPTTPKLYKGDALFWTAEITERISRSRDRLAFAGLM